MHPFLRSSVFLISLTALVRGQSTSSPPPTPAPSNHAILLDQFVTSATPFARNQVDLAQSASVLEGGALLLRQQATLGETLAAEPGMSSTAFAPGASRPIIRGLGGDRIRILENSVGTIDASVTSPDHAVSVEPFLVERIEIVRGPAALLFGSSAIGGVVNVITHRIEDELPAERMRGRTELRFGSAADEFARGGLLDVALLHRPDRALVLHLDGFRRTTEDVRIPGFAESAALRAAEAEEAAEHGEPVPSAARDRLPNSSLATDGGAVGLSFVGREFHLGVSRSGLDSNYGVPGHAHESEETSNAVLSEAAGVRIDLRQRRTDLQGGWTRAAGFLRGARLKLGRANYRHAEIEPDGEIGTVFTHRGHDAHLELLHGDDTGWHGAIGLQTSRTRFGAVGEEAFLPSSLNRDHALFAFEELSRGDIIWQFGGRIERAEITPDGGVSRRDRTVAGSAGTVWKIDPTHSLALSLSHTGRAPNAQELFAGGAHAGTQSFEIGDPALRQEKSLGLEVSLRRSAGFVTGSITAFANRFDNFIFEQPTGEVAHEGDDGWKISFPAEGEPSNDHEALPVYRFVQRDARFWGVEIETLWHLHGAGANQLDLRLAADFTRGREDEGKNLPRLPPPRISTGLQWAAGPWRAGIDAQWFLAQNRVAANETPGKRNTLLGADLSWSAPGRVHREFFVRATNLLDEEIRPHTSFVKDLAPLPGRAISAGLRLRF